MYIPQPLVLITIGIVIGLVTFIAGIFVGIYTGLGTGVNASNKNIYAVMNLLLGLSSWAAVILVGSGCIMFLLSLFN